jgi:hypothetical protein
MQNAKGGGEPPATIKVNKGGTTAIFLKNSKNAQPTQNFLQFVKNYFFHQSNYFQKIKNCKRGEANDF